MHRHAHILPRQARRIHLLRRRRHQIRSHVPSRARNILQSRAPEAQIFFGVDEDLACLVAVFEGGSCIAGHDGSVVEEVEETAAVAGEKDLLFGAFDCRREVEVVGFFELLAGLWGVSGLDGEGGGSVRCLLIGLLRRGFALRRGRVLARGSRV